jgi:hypothetical protein
MKFYGYKFPDFFLEYGPVQAKSVAAAKTAIRRRLGLRRLPPGFSVWDLENRPLTVWRHDAGAAPASRTNYARRPL